MELTTEAQEVAKNLKRAIRKKHALAQSINRDRLIFLRLTVACIIVCLIAIEYAPIDTTKALAAIMAFGLFTFALLGNAFSGKTEPNVPQWAINVNKIFENHWDQSDFIKDSTYWAYPRSKTKISRLGLGKQMLNPTDPDFHKEAMELIAKLAIKYDLQVRDSWFKLELYDVESKPWMTFFAYRGDILTSYHLRQIQAVTDIIFLVETRSENIKAIQKSGYKKRLIASEQLEYIWSGAWNPIQNPQVHFLRFSPSIYWFKPYRITRDIENKESIDRSKQTEDSATRVLLTNPLIWCLFITILGLALANWFEANKEHLLVKILGFLYIFPAMATCFLIFFAVKEGIEASIKAFLFEPLYKKRIRELKQMDPPDDFNEVWDWEFEVEWKAKQKAKADTTLISSIVIGLLFLTVFFF